MPIQALELHHPTTVAERAVLGLVAVGASDQAIAQRLGLGVRAVEARLRRFEDRTQLTGRRLVAWGARHGCCLGDPRDEERALPHGLTPHHVVPCTQQAVLAYLGQGDTDEEIVRALGIRFAALRSRLRRFAATTSLSGRLLVAWSVRHDGCCLSEDFHQISCG